MQILESSLHKATKAVAAPLEPFGVEVSGLSVARLDQNDRALLRNLLLIHKMLLIRGQHLSEAGLIDFTRTFGDELHRAGPSLRYIPDYPEIFRIANRAGAGNLNTGQYWHADGHYLPDPTPISVMHMVKAAPDGATMVADTISAYRNMPQAEKEIIYKHGFLAPETGVAHPITKVHPVTGAIALHLNLHAVAVDSDMKARPQVARMIEEHLRQSTDFCYKHIWRDGDLLVVDNFSTAHCGTYSSPQHLRIMHRTSVTGRSVWWKQ